LHAKIILISNANQTTTSMRKTSLLIAFCFYAFFLFGNEKPNPVVERGHIDLTQVDWQNNLVKLAGEWEFYWKEFLLPDSSDANQRALYAKLPSSWTKIALPDHSNCSPLGYGTYHLQIKVPNQNQVYALKIHSIFTAYAIYVNKEKVSSLGTPGTTKLESKPKFLTQEIPVPVIQNGSDSFQWIDVTIQVSNFHHRRAGIQQPIYFGTLEEVVDATSNTIILNLLLIGIILIIGLNHLMMYFLRRMDVANLMFGVLCVIMILRNLSTEERLLMHLIPNFGWDALVRLDNFSGFATISLFAVYFYFTFRREFPKVMFYLISGIGVIITVLVFTTSAWFYGRFRTLFEIYIGLGGFYITFGVLLRAALRKRIGGAFSFLGMFVLYATAINDVLSSMGIIQTAYVAPYGIVFFMMIQSFLLTRKSALALKENQVLSEELLDEKQKLEQRIEERTHELSKQATELERYRLEQEQQNLVNQSLNAVNEVMHQNKENLELLADQLLATLVKKTNSHLGALYFLNGTGQQIKLKLIASYGLDEESHLEELDLNEGLPGQCYSTGNELFIEDIPERYFVVSSGLGHAKPKVLVLLPLVNDEKVVGVLELASFKKFEKWQLDFLHKALVNIAAQLNLVKISNETTHLLESYKEYESELRKKETEFHELQMELAVLREKTQQMN